MRNDLNVSEKRLIAALDRIDQFLDRTALAQRASPSASSAGDAEARLHELHAENQRLSQELAALHARQASMLSDCETRLAQAHERLVQAGQEAARLSAANEALTSANRALIATQDQGASPDDIRLALEAEVESLRAVRAAEVAQMGEIVDALDRMIDDPAPPAHDDAPPAVVVAQEAETAVIAGDEQASEVAGTAALTRDDVTVDGERG